MTQLPQNRQFVKKLRTQADTQNTQLSSTTQYSVQAPYVALGFSEAGPLNPGLEAHSGMGSETTIILPPSLETVHRWTKCTVQFTSAIPTQIQLVTKLQVPLVSLQPYYFDVEDHSVKPASLDLSPAQVAIDD